MIKGFGVKYMSIYCFHDYFNSTHFTSLNFISNCCVLVARCLTSFVTLLLFTVMLKSAPHPFSHTSAFPMCVLIAFTTASIPPAAPAFTWFSAVHSFSFVVVVVVVLSLCFYHYCLSCSRVHHIRFHIHQHC